MSPVMQRNQVKTKKEVSVSESLTLNFGVNTSPSLDPTEVTHIQEDMHAFTWRKPGG